MANIGGRAGPRAPGPARIDSSIIPLFLAEVFLMKGYALITDLDNTLYDWLSFYGTAFSSMAGILSQILEVPNEQILEEFRQVHQQYANSEQPFAALELPTVKARFPGVPRSDVVKELDEAFHAFNSARRRHLKLYDSVEDTLHWLVERGVKIIGCTDSPVVNGFYRLSAILGVSRYFHRLYVRRCSGIDHPDPERADDLRPPQDIVREFPPNKQKPDPEILRSICEAEGLDCRKTWYVGDSMTRDIVMAAAAGIRSIWARYGTRRDAAAWDILAKITHWTEDDLSWEEELKRRAKDVTPDYTIDQFSDIRGLLAHVIE